MSLINNIKPIEREKWQDHRLEFHYISHNYYEPEVRVRVTMRLTQSRQNY